MPPADASQVAGACGSVSLGKSVCSQNLLPRVKISDTGG